MGSNLILSEDEEEKGEALENADLEKEIKEL